MTQDAQPCFMPQLSVPNAKRNIKTSEELLAQLRELITEQHDFKTVVIDTITKLKRVV